MTCQSLPMWQYSVKKEWTLMKSLIHTKLDLVEKLQTIPFEKLSIYQFKRIQEIENDIKVIYSFKGMIKNLHECYLNSTLSITEGYIDIWKENEISKNVLIKKDLEIQRLKKQIIGYEKVILILGKRLNPTFKVIKP